MVAYNLSHLTQPDNQVVVGPIQDDEALFLFALIRGMLLKRVLEVGGLSGYSARNFLEAVGSDGVVYTVDLNKVPRLAPNHVTLRKDIGRLRTGDLDGKPLDLVFFDCHVYDAQVNAYWVLRRDGMVTDATVLALHDTNVHPFADPKGSAYRVQEGWVHQRVERRMVNYFRGIGYEAFCLHPELSRHSEKLPFRHGLTVMQMPRKLET